MARRIVVLGTGGNCVDIAEAIGAMNQASGRSEFECIGFLDDAPERKGTRVAGLPVLGTLSDAAKLDDCSFINGIGSPQSFAQKPELIARTGLPLERFVSIVHPTASLSPSASLGPGTVLLQHVTVASGVRVGPHVIVLPNSVLSHDDVIGAYTCVAGGVCVSGGVTVGRCCYLGTNSAINGNLHIGDGALVGMGSVVLDDVPNGAVVVGNPARELQ